MNDPVN